MHNVTVLDQKWWLGAYWLSGNKLLGLHRHLDNKAVLVVYSLQC